MSLRVRVFGLLAIGASTLASADTGAGPRYVALGSSYAAGIAIGPLVVDGPKRCGRTAGNYPHRLAERAHLDLVDVSCSGATTEHIRSGWDELPPQLDAVTSDTRLVTVTIGGNDVNYVRDLMRAVCAKPEGGRSSGYCPPAAQTTQANWTALERNVRLIAREVRRRAPGSRLILVDYLRVIPQDRTCASLPLDAAQLARGRATARRLAALTARVAREERAYLLPAGALSKGHETCSGDPWAQGYPAAAAPWHPTAAGHAAVADALAKMISKWRL